MHVDVILFQQQGQLQFEDKWPSMRPTVLKLLHQEPVSRNEWQDLFWYETELCCFRIID